MGEPDFGADGARTAEEIEKWAASVQAKADRYQTMQQQVSAVISSESSRDGIVTVSVDSAGTLRDLRITDDARRFSGSELASSIMTTVRRAQAKITDQVAAVMAETVGDDSETINAVVSSYRQRFPDPDAESEDDNRPPDDDGDFSDESFLE